MSEGDDLFVLAPGTNVSCYSSADDTLDGVHNLFISNFFTFSRNKGVLTILSVDNNTKYVSEDYYSLQYNLFNCVKRPRCCFFSLSPLQKVTLWVIWGEKDINILL